MLCSVTPAYGEVFQSSSQSDAAAPKRGVEDMIREDLQVLAYPTTPEGIGFTCAAPDLCEVTPPLSDCHDPATCGVYCYDGHCCNSSDPTSGCVETAAKSSDDDPLTYSGERAFYGEMGYMYPAYGTYYPLPAERVLFRISKHADGERRGPVSIQRHPRPRLTEASPVPRSDPIQLFGICRRRAPDSR